MKKQGDFYVGPNLMGRLLMELRDNGRLEFVLPLSANSEKTPNTTVEITPLAQNDDGEKSREKIISIIRNNPTVTQSELSYMLQISTKAIEKHIKNLRDDGIIRRVGPDKGGHWEVVNDTHKQ